MSEVKLAEATKEQLLAAAEKLEIAVDGRWGLEKLREEVGAEMEVRKQAKERADANAARIAAEEAAAEETKKSSMPDLAAAVAETALAAQVTPESQVEETPGQRKMRLRREATKLVRVHISCMDPAKTKYKGELICVSNRNIGTIQRFVPFNRDWHIEQVLLDALLDKNYMVFDEEKTPRAGITVKTPRNVPAFNIRILPALTEAELKDLAQRQAMADGTKV